MRDVMLGQLVHEWTATLAAGPVAVLVFKTANSTYTLRVTFSTRMRQVIGGCGHSIERRFITGVS
jgi:hypothetical protein